MKSKLFVVLGVTLLLLVVQVLPASADGIIIITPPVCPRDRPCPTEPVILENLDIRYHHVTVTIDSRWQRHTWHRYFTIQQIWSWKAPISFRFHGCRRLEFCALGGWKTCYRRGVECR